MQEPILANLGNYPVLVKTPTGEFLHVRGGAAVAGPGFDQYVENRTLFRVAPSFPGPVIYETPLMARPEEPRPVTPPPIPQPVPVQHRVEITDEVSAPGEYADLISKLAPEDGPEVPAGGAQAEAGASFGVKYAGNEITIPEERVLPSLSKNELRFILDRIGFKSDGSRGQLLSRLTPLAGKRVAARN